VGWSFKAPEGVYEATAWVATPAQGAMVRVAVGTEKLTAEIPATGAYGTFREMSLGRFQLPGTGDERVLEVRPVKKGWKPMNLQKIILRSVP
jgi:hypothetical protein